MSFVIVDQAKYLDGLRQPCGDLSDELSQLRADHADGFLWVGLKDASSAEFQLVVDELGLHPLAVEDVRNGGNQRAKIESYDGTLFAVLKTLRYIDATSDIETGEIMAFVGPNFLVTIRSGEASPLDGVRHRLEAQPEILRLGPQAAFHGVLDVIVDSYLAIALELEADLESIEDAIFAGDEGLHSRTIYQLKREVLEFKRACLPLSRPLMSLSGKDGPLAGKEIRLFFRDVSDHLGRAIEQGETFDRLLTDILSAHLARVGVQQNADMRKISAWVAIAAMPTMIAGIYGMNFEHMPELGWRYGYPLVLGVMATVCLGLYRLFRRSGWL